MLTPLNLFDKFVSVTFGYTSILTAGLTQYGTEIAGYGYVSIWTKSIAAHFKVLTGTHIKSFTQSRK
jgi:hypothetical protein